MSPDKTSTPPSATHDDALVGSSHSAVILVGHGGVPRDYPRADLQRLKTLEGQRAARNGALSDEEAGLDRRIREWPRTPQNDPYQSGIEALAAALRPRLSGVRLMVAYNEFCAPSLPAAVEALAADGVRAITVIPTMLTPGGSHSEIDIPEALAALRTRHPQLTLRYAWPVDVNLLAAMLADHLQRASAGTAT
ncbi:MAG: CbiX/SirB N-terminal domain-containing protein [bacterium]